MKKILKTGLLVVLGIYIIMSSILIGSAVQENFKILYAILAIMAIITIIAKKIYTHKFSIIENKLDICVVLLMLSSFIPLIFNTYTSLNDEILYIYKYISVFLIYYLAKIIVGKNKKNIKWITNITILGAIIIVIFGIDDMTNKNFLFIANKLNTVTPLNLAKRMISTFGYANSFAGFISFCYILNLGRYLETTEKYRYIYAGIAFCFLSTILLSHSRATVVILLIILLMYIIIIKEKNKRCDVIELCVISGILSIIYNNIFEKCLINKNYYIIWITLVAFSIIIVLLQILIERLNKYIIKIKTKNLIIVGVIICIICTLLFSIGLQLDEPLTIFSGRNVDTSIEYRISQIMKDTNYEWEFEINAKSSTENIEIYSIQLIEQNKYEDVLKEHSIELNNFNGVKKIEFKTTSETERVLLRFNSKQKYAQQGFTINKLTINGEKYVLKYKYLPANLVNRMKDILYLNDMCLSERFVYSIDALKLIKNNWLFGMGGNSWQYRYYEIQSHYYNANQIHCYPIQIFFEFGILGFSCILSIMIILIYYGMKLIKKRKNIELQKLTILTAIAFILIRSFIDFDMTFMHILLITFMYIGIFSSNHKEIKCNEKINNLLVIIIMILCIATSYYNITDLLIEKELKKYENISEQDINFIDKAIKKVPYSRQYKLKKYFILSMQYKEDNIESKIEIIKLINKTERYYFEKIDMAQELVNLSLKQEGIEQIEDIKEAYKIFEEEANKQHLSIKQNIKINKIIYETASLLENSSNEKEEISKKLYSLIKENYERNKKDILDHEKNRFSYEEINKTLEKLDEINNNAIKQLEK